MLRLGGGYSEVMFRFTNIVMYFAPVAVGAAMAYTVARMGLGVLVNLGKLVATLYGALVVFGVWVLVPVALLISACRCCGFCVRWRSRLRLRLLRRTSEAALPSGDGADGGAWGSAHGLWRL